MTDIETQDVAPASVPEKVKRPRKTKKRKARKAKAAASVAAVAAPVAVAVDGPQQCNAEHVEVGGVVVSTPHVDPALKCQCGKC